MKKIIAWEKYENFVNKNIAISKLLMTGKLIAINNHENYEVANQEQEEDDEDMLDEEGEEDEDMVIMQFPITNDLLNSIKLSANFNCWFGHTNFDITKNVVGKLNVVEGVELLSVISRYRFIIGVGKAFDFSEVRVNINKALGINE